MQPIYVVSHTHWDLEWYYTKDKFLLMNVDMMDILLNILKSDETYVTFMLDGQLAMLEDYLSVKPEMREVIQTYVKEGRLSIGPWYVLPDEYLASGEAHIRNFLEGMRISEKLGGGKRIGYLPDSFGHPSQMPQIIKGLGMQEMIFWRGTGPEVNTSEFTWQGKDGSKILAINMPYGYSNAACLPQDRDARQERLNHEIGKLMKLSATGTALLMNGSDHVAPDAKLPQYIKQYNEEQNKYQLIHTSMKDYVDIVKDKLRAKHSQVVEGELRCGYRAYLLGDTLSTRIPLKQRHRTMEINIENKLEPISAMQALHNGSTHPKDKLHYLWRLLLQNLPHDSICGCGVDEVHEQMHHRYDQMEEITRHLLEDAASIGTTFAKGEAYDGAIVVWNSLLVNHRSPIHVTLDKVLHPLRYVDYNQDQALLEFDGDSAPTPTGIEFIDGQGNCYEGIIEDVSIVDTVEHNPFTQPTMNRCQRIRARFTAQLPSVSQSTFAYRFLYQNKEMMQEHSLSIKNEYFVVTAKQDGTISLLDKLNNVQYEGLNGLIDEADAGDEYTFDPLPNDVALSIDPQSVKLAREHDSLLISGILKIPQSLTVDRKHRSQTFVDCPFTSRFGVYQGVNRVEVQTKVQNLAKDHRLSVLFPLGKTADRCMSDSTFSIETREIVRETSSSQYEDWMEKPNNSFYQKNFSDIASNGIGLAVFVKGLPQFSIYTQKDNDQISLTLLRCVGWLSRKDLSSRKGNGGWSIETPGAQEIGCHVFEYAIYPHDKVADTTIYHSAQQYVVGATAMQITKSPLDADAIKRLESTSMICVEDARIHLSALKQREEGNQTILRLVNLSGDEVKTNFISTYPLKNGASKCTLDERTLEPLQVKNNQIELSFLPWEVITLAYEREV